MRSPSTTMVVGASRRKSITSRGFQVTAPTSILPAKFGNTPLTKRASRDPCSNTAAAR